MNQVIRNLKPFSAMEQGRIKRIQQMEEVYDRVKKVVDNLDVAFAAYEDIQKDIPILAEYEESGM